MDFEKKKTREASAKAGNGSMCREESCRHEMGGAVCTFVSKLGGFFFLVLGPEDGFVSA